MTKVYFSVIIICVPGKALKQHWLHGDLLGIIFITCACGGIGRHARFRIWWETVGVQVPPGAPKDDSCDLSFFNYLELPSKVDFQHVTHYHQQNRKRKPVEVSRRVLVGMTGFEPAAYYSRSNRATKLRHIPK